jgi:hypothetical protein
LQLSHFDPQDLQTKLCRSSIEAGVSALKMYVKSTLAKAFLHSGIFLLAFPNVFLPLMYKQHKWLHLESQEELHK